MHVGFGRRRQPPVGCDRHDLRLGLGGWALYHACGGQNSLAGAPGAGADVGARSNSRTVGNLANPHAPSIGITNGFSEMLLRDRLFAIEQCQFFGLIADLLELGIGIIHGPLNHVFDIEFEFRVLHCIGQIPPCHRFIRMIEPDDFIESAPDGGIELPVQVGGRDEEPAWLDLIDEDQQGVDDSAQLAVIASLFARAGERVELIEEQDAGLTAGELEGLANVGRGLAQKRGDEPIEFDMEERQPKLAGKDLSAQCLPGSGRSAEQEL